MDSALRAQGLYRKRVAKDGSCLFRAVAEQVLHSQSRHIDVRMACIDYLRKNREKFEAFIEGSFEDYLKCLENPQEWVGQVEISALSLMYKKDIIIYQEPNAAPSCVTENGFPDKVLLCFSNGNHYDVVYPIEYAEKAALCQSVLYELLYHKVFGTDVNKILEELHAPDVTEESNGSSEISSESEADDNYKSKTAAVSDMNGLKSRSGSKHLKTNGNPTSFTLPRKVVKSLNPSVYRNVEYEVWQQSKRDQQKRDFSIAAGMQYSVGDKCKVRLDHNGKLYNAHIQEVCSENGPVVVFVEELGAKHSVSLKSLKPLPQASPMEAWNTVSGKKIKKFPPTCGQNVQPDADCRRPKNQNKPIKTQSVLPPRLQHAVGTRQHQFSNSGPQSQQTSAEQKTLGSRSASQAVRKADRERTEDLDYASRDCNYFGLSPEERREKQAIEESRSLYEIQQRDEQAFPALSNQSATQTADTFNKKKFPVVSEGRNSKWGSDVEERKDKDSESRQMRLNQKLEPNSSERNGGDEKYPEASPPLEQAKTQSLSPAEQRLTEHLPCVNPAASPVFSDVHLLPTVPSLPAIVPAWPNEPTTYGPTGIPGQMPVSSLMPPPTTGPDSVTLNPYQDPLYPGFPFNEKGERAIAPPYSLCSTDLPKDKSILRFFFNLGIKAYSCPMWAPHSYLYPLHQAYVAACRMYPNVSVPVYPHNPWFQETLLTPNESETAQTNRHFPMQSEARCNGQSSQVDSFIENSVVRPNVVMSPEDKGATATTSENLYLAKEGSSPVPVTNFVEQLQKTKSDSSSNAVPPPVASVHGECDVLNETSARVPKMEQIYTAASAEQTKAGLPNRSPQIQGVERQTVMSSASPSLSEPSKNELKSTVPSRKEKADKARDPKTAGNVQTSSGERAQRTKEESSEDEHEVSDMLRSGRPKQFYNQTYGGGRRPRNEWGYPSRGGYQYPRGEEAWKGPPNRGRDEGYQYHRNFRGRPYRNDKRRATLGDGQRGHQI
ncbi:OTU domain-containing protein 4 [Alligator mississippiensis]|uniref:OTU domain-containing protein 4 n=1 Tax=Alligator mississippiensis TaxID=8496 RepID=A0A151MYM4_ALLMI|nr:OTU domain-containing protein 4 [Alligator mississippiensis]